MTTADNLVTRRGIIRARWARDCDAVRLRAHLTSTEISADPETRNVADLLRGTPRLNVLISRTVFGVSGQCRVAVIGLKRIDRAFDYRAMSINGSRGAGPLLTLMRRAWNE